MFNQIVIFALISAPAAFFAAVFRRRYEQTLPLACAAIVLLLFLFGVLGILNAGVAVVAVLCIAMYPAAAIYVLHRDRKARVSTFLKNFFTPLFLLFFCIFVYFILLNKGRVASGHDELSHWADVVKAMFTVGALNSSPECFSTFQSYPPAMGLFQLFFQKINALLSPGAGFTEWMLYSAYQVFSAAFILPFFSKLSFKKVYTWLALAMVFLAPLAHFQQFYSQLLIDPFLGLVSGAGLAMILTEEKSDVWTSAYVFLCVAILTLSKSAGLVFAVFLLLAYAVRILDEEGGLKAGIRKKMPIILCGAAFVFVPKLLWELSLKCNNAAIAFDGRVDLGILINVLTGRDTSYRSVLLDGYYNAVLSGAGEFNLLGRDMTYLLSFALMILALFLMCRFSARCRPEKAHSSRLIFVLMLIEFALYLVGMLISYMFKFSQYEASRMLGFSRYIAIPLLSMWMAAILGFVGLLHKAEFDRSLATAVVFCVVLAALPGAAVSSLASRESVAQSEEARQDYVDVCDRFYAIAPEEPQRIYLISQEDSGFDYQMLHYLLRPHILTIGPSWSLGTAASEADQWSREYSPQQWQEELVEKYDYVLIYRLNDQFVQNYGHLFENREDIREQGIYAVDRSSGLLKLCS